MKLGFRAVLMRHERSDRFMIHSTLSLSQTRFTLSSTYPKITAHGQHTLRLERVNISNGQPALMLILKTALGQQTFTGYMFASSMQDPSEYLQGYRHNA